MSTEKETLTAQKAAILDLKLIIKENARKDPEKVYTSEEIDDLLDAYVRGLESSISK